MQLTAAPVVTKSLSRTGQKPGSTTLAEPAYLLTSPKKPHGQVQTPPGAPQKSAGLHPSKARATLLLVDDEETIRYINQEILTQSGYQTLLASTGEEALSIYSERAQKVDLIVLDLAMPGMGGARALAKLKELNPAVKVIIASGYLDAALTKELKRLGVNAFLNKPYPLTKLVETVQEVLAG